MLETLEALGRDRLLLTGELRSFNNRRAEGAKLVLTVFAREAEAGGEEDENLVALTGTLCKPPNLRVTPMGRDICDLMLAVNRRYGRSDYLPCICWGLKAREAACWDVGTQLRLEGRFQSRGYVKLTETGPVQRVAYEVSVNRAEETEG
jgi:primosomal replication protein N